MKRSFVFYFFKLAGFTLALGSAFPKKRIFKDRVRLFLLYKVWPVVFVMIWVPMVPMVFQKAMQFQSNKDWDQLLDIMHMFIIGCFTLYMLCVVQITSSNYYEAMEIVEGKFRTKNDIALREFLPVFLLWVGIPVCYLLFVGGCIFYKENMVPLWVPFVDNNEISTEVFLGIWAYELVPAFFIFITFTIWSPFIIVSTVCICRELDCLVGAVNWYGSAYIADGNLQQEREGRLGSNTLLNIRLCTSQDMVRFVRKIVQHHITVKSAITNVARIHSYVFLVQTIVVVVHSCFLAFNMYYTTNVEKVMLKSTPILFVSYYLMFAYCWNGQNLTEKFVIANLVLDYCTKKMVVGSVQGVHLVRDHKVLLLVVEVSHELALALYRFPWYNCPHSYRSSMLIMMEILKRPVYLTGGGLMTASLATFITCFQQSFSYILILKALTPEKEPS